MPSYFGSFEAGASSSSTLWASLQDRWTIGPRLRRILPMALGLGVLVMLLSLPPTGWAAPPDSPAKVGIATLPVDSGVATAVRPIPLSARISMTGSVEAEGEGAAFWLQRRDPVSGQDGFIVVLTLKDGGDLRMLEFAFLSGTRPRAGNHSILSIDAMMDMMEEGEWTTGVMASYASGDFSSWQELSDLIASPDLDYMALQRRMTGSGTGVAGEVQIQGGAGTTLEGQVSAEMVLVTEFGDELPFQVSATFVASEGP